MGNSKAVDIAERFEPKIRKALLEAFDAMRGRVSIAEITRQLETRGIEGIMSLLSGMENDLAPVRDHLRNALQESGRATIGAMPRAAVLNSTFAFDVLNTSTVDYIRNYELNLIRLISTNTREAVRQAIQRDIIAGRNPRDTAKLFRDTIGLTPKQEQAVANYRHALETLDRQALKRTLRDRRFDRTIGQALDRGKPLTPEQIDRMVGRYRERYIKYRSEVIARTESLRATTVGQRASIKQMLAGNAVDAMKIRRFWIFTHDSRTRNGHRQIPDMNQDGVELDGYYRTPLGPLAYPRDPNGSGDNTIQCRCTERYQLVEED